MLVLSVHVVAWLKVVSGISILHLISILLVGSALNCAKIDIYYLINSLGRFVGFARFSVIFFWRYLECVWVSLNE